MVPVALQVTIDGAHKGEDSNVELSILVQQWLLDVLLNNVTSLVSIMVSILDQVLDVVQILYNCYTTSSVGILSWLHDPELSPQLWI